MWRGSSRSSVLQPLPPTGHQAAGGEPSTPERDPRGAASSSRGPRGSGEPASGVPKPPDNSPDGQVQFVDLSP